MELLVTQLLILVSVGVAAGLASGLFGIGGGIITVPALATVASVMGFPAPFRAYVAASLLAITLGSPVGIWKHNRHRNVKWRLSLPVVAGGLIGVGTAILVDTQLTERNLILAFAGFLIFSCHRILYAPQRVAPVTNVFVLGTVGWFSGLAGKLFGVGGGLIVVPTLTFAGLTIHAAVATALISVFTNSLMGTAINLFVDPNSDWIVWGLALGAGTQVGAYWGAHFGNKTSDTLLRSPMGLLMLAFSTKLVFDAFTI